MSSEYRLKRAHGQQKVLIHAADLYLLEKWKDDPNILDETQRSAIFSKWLEIGSLGRLPYVERLEIMYKEKDDITEAEKDLLARVRKPSDRRDTGTTRLIRTFYGEGSDDSFAELLDEAEFDLDFQPHFDDATLYDAGSNNGFQSLHEILTRLPQILEHTAWFFDFREEQKQEALKEAPGLFTDNFEYSVEITHKAARWGNVFIYDKEAYYEGDILLVYFDDHGRVIRYYRVEGADDLSNAATMIDSGQDFMHGWWMAGHYGEDYEPHELAKRWREFEPENSKEGASVNVISEEQKL